MNAVYDLPQGHRRAGSGGRATPSLTRNAHVAWDEGRADHRGTGAGRRRRDRLQHEQEEERRHRGPDGAGEPHATWSAPSPRAARSSRRPRWTSAPTSPAASSRSRWRRATWCARASSCSRSTRRSTRPRCHRARGRGGLHPGHAAPGPGQPRPGRARTGSAPDELSRLGPNLIAPASRLRQAQTALDVAEATYQATRAQLDQSRAGLQEAQDNLAKTRLISPDRRPGGAAGGGGGRSRGAGHLLAGDRPADDHRRPVGDPGQGAGGRDRRGAPHASATRWR